MSSARRRLPRVVGHHPHRQQQHQRASAADSDKNIHRHSPRRSGICSSPVPAVGRPEWPTPACSSTAPAARVRPRAAGSSRRLASTARAGTLDSRKAMTTRCSTTVRPTPGGHERADRDQIQPLGADRRPATPRSAPRRRGRASIPWRPTRSAQARVEPHRRLVDGDIHDGLIERRHDHADHQDQGDPHRSARVVDPTGVVTATTSVRLGQAGGASASPHRSADPALVTAAHRRCWEPGLAASSNGPHGFGKQTESRTVTALVRRSPAYVFTARRPPEMPP